MEGSWAALGTQTLHSEPSEMQIGGNSPSQPKFVMPADMPPNSLQSSISSEEKPQANQEGLPLGSGLDMNFGEG